MTIEYGVSLLGVMIAVSLYVKTRASFLIWLNGALNCPEFLIDGIFVHHSVVHHDRQAVDEAFLGDIFGLADVGPFRLWPARLPGRGVVVVTVSAASAAERRRSRFVNI